MTEQDTVRQVLARIQQLGLPEPVSDYRLGHKTYDLAWPDQFVAVEISQRKRPADTNGWTVGHVKPTMTDNQIDKVLKALPL